MAGPDSPGRRTRNEPSRAKSTSAATAAPAKGVITARTGAAKKPARPRPAAAEAAKPSARSRPAAVEAAKPPARSRPAAAEAAKPSARSRPAAAEAAKPSARSRPAAVEPAKPPARSTPTQPVATPSTAKPAATGASKAKPAADPVPGTAARSGPTTPGGRHRRAAEPLEPVGRHRAEQQPHHAQPQPSGPPVDPETGLPPGMTRGILELAAERLAAARAAARSGDDGQPEAVEPEPEPTPAGRQGQPEPEPATEQPAQADPAAADVQPGRSTRRRPVARSASPIDALPAARAARREAETTETTALAYPAPAGPTPLSHAGPAAPTADPDPGLAPTADPDPAPDAPAGRTGTSAYPGLDEDEITRPIRPHDTAELPRILAEPEHEDAAWFWSTTDHPPAGLPESLRLPVGIPEGLWHPAEHEPPQDDRPTREQPVLTRPAHEQPVLTSPAHQPPALDQPGDDHQSRAEAAEPRPETTDPVVETDRSLAEDAGGHTGIRARLTPSGRKLLRRRRRVTFLAYLLIVFLILMVGHELRDPQRPTAVEHEAAPRVEQPHQPPRLTPEQEKREQVGSVRGVLPTAAEASGRAGDFRYARTRGPVLGRSGRMHRFKVAVEETVGDVDPDDFSAMLDRTLGDERSWIGSGDLRLRRVPESSGDAEFTVFLASPATSEKMCAEGGLHTEGYTSCRVPGQVIINAERWAAAVPDYGDDLDAYRQYTINHEIGHQLGHGHESCPGRRRPAPVMLQQTYGLDGCTRNPWPYLDGKRYSGEARR
ncbi:DUF3152 domain-containing protein [Actinoplanes siamensis]